MIGMGTTDKPTRYRFRANKTTKKPKRRTNKKTQPARRPSHVYLTQRNTLSLSTGAVLYSYSTYRCKTLYGSTRERFTRLADDSER